MQKDNLDMVQLTKTSEMSNEYHLKLVDKLKDNFNDEQQKLFVASFYCYNNNRFKRCLEMAWV